MNIQINIRIAHIDDLPFIVDIYNQAIRSGQATGDMKEFNVEERFTWFEKFDSNSYPIYVAETKNKVVGYCTLSPYRPGRQAMQTVAEIGYFLHHSFHRQGIATALLKHVISDCSRLRILSLLAIILDINTPTIGLLENFNFEKWGYFPGIIDMDGKKYGQFVYGLIIKDQQESP